MNETSALDDIEHPEEAAEPSPMRVALGFFILPMLLVLGAIGVFLLFGLIAHEDKTIEEYLAEVRGGGINEPWQGAFGLASKLTNDESQWGNPRTARQIEAVLDHPDPDVRKYLVLAIGRVAHESSVPVLADYLEDPSPDVRGNTLWALGNIGAPQAAAVAPLIAGRLRDDDEQVRGYAAYVLGSLDDSDSVEPLEVALNDPAVQVRGNAAVALARLGSDAGVAELRRMIDRDYLISTEELNAQQQQDAMIAAIQAFAMIGVDAARGELTDLRDNDPDLRVREAARAALDSEHRPSLP